MSSTTGSPAPSPEAIDRALKSDRASPADRAALHRAAADLAPCTAARRFHLTHAWIFALEAGLPEAEHVARDLRDLGGL